MKKSDRGNSQHLVNVEKSYKSQATLHRLLENSSLSEIYNGTLKNVVVQTAEPPNILIEQELASSKSKNKTHRKTSN